MLNKIIHTELKEPIADLAILILRIGVSLLMITHGWDKMMNLFEGNWDFPDPIGIGSGASAFLTVFAEFFCSLLLILGLFTRVAVIPLIITMLVAVFIIHANDDLGTKEHGLLFLFPYAALFLLGSGKYSFDFFIQRILKNNSK